MTVNFSQKKYLFTELKHLFLASKRAEIICIYQHWPAPTIVFVIVVLLHSQGVS